MTTCTKKAPKRAKVEEADTPPISKEELRNQAAARIAELEQKLQEAEARRLEETETARQMKANIDQRVEAATLKGKKYPQSEHSADMAAWRGVLDQVDRLETSGRALTRELERERGGLAALMKDIGEDGLAVRIETAKETKAEIVELFNAMLKKLEDLRNQEKEFSKKARAIRSEKKFPVRLRGLVSELNADIVLSRIGTQHFRINGDLQPYKPAEPATPAEGKAAAPLSQVPMNNKNYYQNPGNRRIWCPPDAPAGGHRGSCLGEQESFDGDFQRHIQSDSGDDFSDGLEHHRMPTMGPDSFVGGGAEALAIPAGFSPSDN